MPVLPPDPPKTPEQKKKEAEEMHKLLRSFFIPSSIEFHNRACE
jgi:hypothetical protein